MRFDAMTAGCLAAAIALTLGCNGGSGSGGAGEEEFALSGAVEIDGSSTVAPISEAVAEAFEKEYPEVSVTVGTSGTGGGFKRFTVGDTDISDASRPIKPGEFVQAKENGVGFVELPVAYDGLTIVVNPQNDFIDELTVDQLRKLFNAEGSPPATWKELNADWPNEEISLFIPGTDSGTFDYFQEVLEVAIRDDVQTSEDDNVLVRGVANEPYALGFFGVAYYEENKGKLKAVPIINPETGEAVEPTPETIAKGEYAPFSRPLLIYVASDSLTRPEVKTFVNFYLDHAGELGEGVGYVALPGEIYDRARTHVAERLSGTHFFTSDGEKRRGGLPKVYTSENLLSIDDDVNFEG